MPRFLRASWLVLIASQFLPVWFSSYALILVMVALVTVFSKWEWRQAVRHRWVQLWTIFVAWQLISLLWTTNFKDAAANLSTQLLLGLVPFLFFLKPPAAADRSLLFRTQIVAATLASLFALGYGFWRVGQLPSPDGMVYTAYLTYTGLAEPIMHPGYFSLQLVVALTLCVRLVYEKTWKNGPLVWGIVLVLLVTLVLLNGRMTLFSALLTMGVLLVVQAFRRKKWGPLLVFAGALALLVVSGVYLLPDRMQERFRELTGSFRYDIATYGIHDYNGITIRLAQLECAAELIARHPLIGVGIGDGKDELRSVYAAKGYQVGIEQQYNSHNQLVESTIFGGLVQSGWLLFIFVSGLLYGWRSRRKYFTAFLFFIFICFQTETILFWHRGVLFFALFAALFLSDRPDRAVSGEVIPSPDAGG